MTQDRDYGREGGSVRSQGAAQTGATSAVSEGGRSRPDREEWRAGEAADRGTIADRSSEEHQPQYGYYYARALRRGGVSRPGGWRGEGGHGGPYGTQHIRGTGGQSNPQRAESGRWSDYRTSSRYAPGGFEGGATYGATGTELERELAEGRYEPERWRPTGEWERGQEGWEGRYARSAFGRGPARYGRPEGDYEYGRGYGEISGRPYDYGYYPAGPEHERRFGWGQRAEGRYGLRGYEHEGYGRDVGELQRERRTRWQREPLTAREIMTEDVKAVTKLSTLRNVAQIMKDENCGIVPVVDEDYKLQGVVTDRDIVIRALAEDKPVAELKVEDIMTDDVHAVTPDESLHDIVDLMGDKQVRRVPVVDRNDRLIGIISMGDIATRADYDEDLQEALEKVSARRSFWSRLWS